MADLYRLGDAATPQHSASATGSALNQFVPFVSAMPTPPHTDSRRHHFQVTQVVRYSALHVPMSESWPKIDLEH